MLPKIKKFIMENKKIVILVSIILLAIILLLVLYKSLFYSNAEKAVYGDRLRDIKKNEYTKEDRVETYNKVSEMEGVSEAKIFVKGRLIKFYVTFNDGLSADDIKNKFNEMLTFIEEDVKEYYDVTFYAVQTAEGKTKYPVIGYKQKGRELISFDTF